MNRIELKQLIREEIRSLAEASAGEEAKKRGLVHVSFGRYADPSDPKKVVAKSVNGKLVAVKGQSAKGKGAAPKSKKGGKPRGQQKPAGSANTVNKIEQGNEVTAQELVSYINSQPKKLRNMHNVDDFSAYKNKKGNTVLDMFGPGGMDVPGGSLGFRVEIGKSGKAQLTHRGEGGDNPGDNVVFSTYNFDSATKAMQYLLGVPGAGEPESEESARQNKQQPPKGNKKSGGSIKIKSKKEADSFIHSFVQKHQNTKTTTDFGHGSGSGPDERFDTGLAAGSKSGQVQSNDLDYLLGYLSGKLEGKNSAGASKNAKTGQQDAYKGSPPRDSNDPEYIKGYIQGRIYKQSS